MPAEFGQGPKVSEHAILVDGKHPMARPGMHREYDDAKFRSIAKPTGYDKLIWPAVALQLGDWARATNFVVFVRTPKAGALGMKRAIVSTVP